MMRYRNPIKSNVGSKINKSYQTFQVSLVYTIYVEITTVSYVWNNYIKKHDDQEFIVITKPKMEDGKYPKYFLECLYILRLDISEIKYGSVTLIVQDGVVIQIERKEKIRLKLR